MSAVGLVLYRLWKFSSGEMGDETIWLKWHYWKHGNTQFLRQGHCYSCFWIGQSLDGVYHTVRGAGRDGVFWVMTNDGSAV